MKRLVLMALALAACSKSEGEQAAAAAGNGEAAPSTPAAEVARDDHHARIIDPTLGDVPFYIAIPTPPAAGDALVIDGERRIRLPARWDGDALTIGLEMFGARITAKRDPTTRALTGTWEPSSLFAGKESRRFRAEPRAIDPAARADLGAAPPVDLGAPSTIWRATFADSGDAKLEVEQPADGVLHATVTLGTGNVMYLAGNARGDTFRLSAFDGYSMYLFAGKLAPDGKSLTGDWAAGPKLDWREAVQAVRADPFDLPITFRAEVGAAADFVPEREKYAGKPLVVLMSATWSAASFNADPLLRELHAAHAAKGLQMVTLLYEMVDDPAKDRAAAEAYRREHRTPWDVVPIAGSLARADELIPPALGGVDLSAFPIAIFVGRDGAIKAAHAGFPGPESKTEHARAVAAYRAGVAAILGPL